MGAPGEDLAGKSGAGRIYLLSGEDGSVLQTYQSPNPKGQIVSGGFVSEPGGGFGAAVESVGDIDGDSLPDIVVGAPNEETVLGTEEGGRDTVRAGRAYVISGTDGSVLHRLTSLNPTSGGSFGGAVASIGDINGDGVTEIIVGAKGENVTEAGGEGRAYLFDGADGTVLKEFTSSHPFQSGGFGHSVSGIGDVTDDGVPDMLVGAPSEFVDERKFAGRVYVVSGKEKSIVQSLTGPDINPNVEFGTTVDGIGDIDGDEVPDVVVGVPQAGYGDQRDAGEAHVLSGSNGSLIQTLVSPPGRQKEARFGSAVKGIEDVTGDGIPDVLIGEERGQVGEYKEAGRAFLLSGASGDSVRTFNSREPEMKGHFGAEVSIIRRNDGNKKVVVGAPGESVGNKEAAGQVYMFDLGSENSHE